MKTKYAVLFTDQDVHVVEIWSHKRLMRVCRENPDFMSEYPVYPVRQNLPTYDKGAK